MYGYIYKTTNLLDGKIYIGKKKSSKFLNDRYLGSGRKLKEAINNLGIENFKVELIEECFSMDELNRKEQYYIDKYDARNPEIGYNISKGGEGPGIFIDEETQEEFVFSKEAREKMSQSAKLREHLPTTDGRVGYTNGEDYRVIEPEDIPRYESLGWWHGRPESYKGKEPPNKGKKGMQVSEKKGKITIHYPGLSEIKNKFIPITEYEFYYTQGWIRGSRIFKNCIL